MKRYEFSDEKSSNSREQQNPELEAAIYENPENPDAWAVYGDWLQSRSDPRGEAIAIEVARAKGDRNQDLKTRMDEILAANQTAWVGEELLTAQEMGGEQVVDLEWKYGFLYRARVSTEYEFEGPDTTDLLKALLDNPSSRFLHELVIGIPQGAEEGDADFTPCIAAITQAGERPSIRKLHMGDFDSEECEISWSSIGPVDELLPGLPNLEELLVHGGGIDFREMRHAKLKKLVLESGGLPAGTIKALSKGVMPALEKLEIWLGHENWGGDAKISDFQGFFSSTNYPELTHLGLLNSQIQNEIAAALVNAPILKQIKILDLSMGTMTDKGAKILIEGARALKHLEAIIVENNFLSDELSNKLKKTFKGKINTASQKIYDGNNNSLYVSVGE